MTTAADDSAVEDAFEALLVGRPVPEGAAGLAAFTEAVRASATLPGRPNAALAELLATGLLTDQSSPSVRTARSAGSAPEGLPFRVRIRRRTTMIFPVLLAKFLSAGALAQAATGATVAVVAFTGVGAVGALPDPVQDTFATVVSDITPLEPPTSGQSTEGGAPEGTDAEDLDTTDENLGTSDEDLETTDEETGTTDETTEPIEDAAAVEASVKAWALTGPAADEPFGAWVSKGSNDAHVKDWLRAHGMTFGNVVSAWASGKGFSKEQLAALGADPGAPVDVPVVTAPEGGATQAVPETEVAAPQPATTQKGNGNGNGKKAGSNGNAGGNGNAKGNGHN
jgi:hypothetical protein